MYVYLYILISVFDHGLQSLNIGCKRVLMVFGVQKLLCEWKGEAKHSIQPSPSSRYHSQNGVAVTLLCSPVVPALDLQADPSVTQPGTPGLSSHHTSWHWTP